MRYKIYTENPQSHVLTIEMVVENIASDRVKIQIPAWRPGRYELQNFAKNIQHIEVFDESEQPVAFHKTSKDRWKVYTKGLSKFTVRLQYYAFLKQANGVFANAGSSYVDEHTLYVNFVNCLPYVSGRMNEPHEVQLNLPENYQVACGLSYENGAVVAEDYYQLMDAPLLASPYLQHRIYEIQGVPFYVWFLGNYQPDWDKIIPDFQRFSEKQIQVMGGFPEKSYHFINWILPMPFYHGVEHRNSTMIVLGPDAEGEGLYTDLLGISSHELYHAWNICKIRPIEMMPYDLTKENYFHTGFVAEGVTTYLGDVFLKQAGVFDLQAYLKELEATLKRHFEQDGLSKMSLLEASYDLWLDGYVPPVPHRRVSIYNKGAVVAFILDTLIRQKSQHQRSIHDVMRLMNERFGKTGLGYSLEDYIAVAEEVYGDSLEEYVATCLAGNTPLESQVKDLLAWYGIDFAWQAHASLSFSLVDAQNQNLIEWLG